MLENPMPRRKLFTERVNLPLTADLLAKIDAALEPDEVRVDFLRDAAKRELSRREAAAKRELERPERQARSLVNVSVITGPEAQAKAAARKRKPERQS